MALTLLCVGALPFVKNAGAYAQDDQWRWLDDPHQKVGLTYGVSQTVQSAYLWRGLYAGGPNTQIDANVGYGGAYIDMWWNLGTTDITFRHFQPEVDISVGFKRWGLNIYMLHIHNFNCGLFDFHNYPDKGNRLELNAQYTLSSKIPLTFKWATRVSAADGYVSRKTLDDGQTVSDTVRAWSSYAEINYKQQLPSGFSLYYAFGITPWRSCYTGYEGGFAVQNIEIIVRKDWTLHDRVGMMAFGQMAVSPCAPMNVININFGLGIYLK